MKSDKGWRFLAGGPAHLEKTGEDQSSLASEILMSSRAGWLVGFIGSANPGWSWLPRFCPDLMEKSVMMVSGVFFGHHTCHDIHSTSVQVYEGFGVTELDFALQGWSLARLLDVLRGKHRRGDKNG